MPHNGPVQHQVQKRKAAKIANIVAIAGRGGSGKSTVADILVNNHGFVSIGLADPMKRFLKELFSFTDEQLWGPSENRNKPFQDGDARMLVHGALEAMAEGPCHLPALTPREALQTLGTQWGRAMYEDVWIDKAVQTANLLLYGTSAPTKFDPNETCARYTPQDGLVWDQPMHALLDRQGIVIADCRFPNELAAIRAAGGRLWVRPGGGLTGAAASHASEAGFGNFAFDSTIPWEDDVKNLDAVVARLMKDSP